jgi:predicted transcriptional regulator
MFNNLPIYKIIPIFNKKIEIALVEEPAIEEYFLFFNKEEEAIKYNQDKMIIEGVVMIPNTPILRNSPFPHYVVYDADSIEECAKLFFKNNAKFNIKHEEIEAEILIVESYFLKNDAKYPDGSWYVKCKVEDNELWDKIKSGEFKGFSFQSLFLKELINNNTMTKKEQFMKYVNEVLFAEEVAVVEPISEEVVPQVDFTDKINELEERLNSIVNKLTELETSIIRFEEMVAEIQKTSTEKTAELETKIEEFGKQEISKVVTDKPHMAYISK